MMKLDLRLEVKPVSIYCTSLQKYARESMERNLVLILPSKKSQRLASWISFYIEEKERNLMSLYSPITVLNSFMIEESLQIFQFFSQYTISIMYGDRIGMC